MNKKIIQVFEHSKILIPQDISKSQFDLLISYGEKTNYKYYNIGRNNIKFKSYVGVIQIDYLTIEILPKINKSDYSGSREFLISMLKKSGYFKINYKKKANQSINNISLLKLFKKNFLKKIQLICFQGLKKQYRKEEKNRKVLKGKLIFHQHVNKNLIHKERFYTSSNTYDIDNIYNQIIKKALLIISFTTSNYDLKKNASTLLLNFEDVSTININVTHFELLTFNRQTERYKTSIELAKLIILNLMPTLSSGKKSVLALLFDMNDLFEKYITNELSSTLFGYNVLGQKPQKYLLINKNNKNESFKLKPDITIKKENSIVAIFDAKWKLLIPEDKKRGICQSDLYQLYTYSNEYNCKKVALIYPKWREDQVEIEKFYFSECKNEIMIISIPLVDLMTNKNIRKFIIEKITTLLLEN